MTKVQKKFSAEFKAKVALAALQNQMTVAEIIEKFGVSKTMVYKWKAEAQANLATVFGKQDQAKGAQREVDNLNRKIGELTMELDFAKRASEALGIGMPAKS